MAETRPKQRDPFPAWAVIAIGAVLTGAGLLWSSTLYDERGNELLDGPTATVLVALLGVVGTVLTLLLQKSKHVEHELKPNSGTSMRDQTNRIESMVQTLLLDIGGLRQENRDDRRAVAERFAQIEARQDTTNAKLDAHLDWSRVYVQNQKKEKE